MDVEPERVVILASGLRAHVEPVRDGGWTVIVTGGNGSTGVLHIVVPAGNPDPSLAGLDRLQIALLQAVAAATVGARPAQRWTRSTQGPWNGP